MIAFAFHDKGCRESAVLRYFGETPKAPCGRCDNCRAAERANIMEEPSVRWEVDEGHTTIDRT